MLESLVLEYCIFSPPWDSQALENFFKMFLYGNNVFLPTKYKICSFILNYFN